MNDRNISFYNEWAERELCNNLRHVILRWKATNLANLFLRTLKINEVESVCEIGGAEGTVLYYVSQVINAKKIVNFEISEKFCKVGNHEYPNIDFNNLEFSENEADYNLIILSDIIEHINDEDQFLAMVAAHCDYVLLKIPIEKCAETTIAPFLPHHEDRNRFKYGPTHYNGHLRGYTISQAKKIISKYFLILDSLDSDVLFFYGTQKRLLIKKWIGSKGSIFLFGGALFILGKSKTPSQKK